MTPPIFSRLPLLHLNGPAVFFLPLHFLRFAWHFLFLSLMAFLSLLHLPFALLQFPLSVLHLFLSFSHCPFTASHVALSL
ncbi:uncharacterized protein B0J16DRAFT_351222 [Fusarium flagelliforme]|uniref:uncharacterized protein n=1 Tax=Fusarium flagelliforme TaxID=2675880 RepID=UPI001E8E4929|nr:uncharacterized protein B0J16DRAFT_351222 [Fusarium flagelliforme]KAH7174008.1 hypothetical protein B0J16DRAFT_351222 [Fusarium flagelliforme]